MKRGFIFEFLCLWGALLLCLVAGSPAMGDAVGRGLVPTQQCRAYPLKPLQPRGTDGAAKDGTFKTASEEASETFRQELEDWVKKHGTPVYIEPLNPEQQKELLAKRITPGMGMALEPYLSLLYALHRVPIYFDVKGQDENKLESPFPDFYQPTWAEFFDAIARQTGTRWKYGITEKGGGGWRFSKPPLPLPYSLTVPEGWTVNDNEGFMISYRPPPGRYHPAEGMDVYIKGTYSAEKEVRNSLFIRVRDEIALSLAKPADKDITAKVMARTTVDGTEALFWEYKNPQRPITGRLWAFVKDGKAFAFFSAMGNENEDALLPQVEAMVKSFKVLDHQLSDMVRP
ncbi:MAG: hypothetical protein AB1646_10340 [Thermodesulfobacteriota bacterium]